MHAWGNGNSIPLDMIIVHCVPVSKCHIYPINTYNQDIHVKIKTEKRKKAWKPGMSLIFYCSHLNLIEIF